MPITDPFDKKRQIIDPWEQKKIIDPWEQQQQPRDLLAEAGSGSQAELQQQQEEPFLKRYAEKLGFTNKRRTLQESLQSKANHPVTNFILGAGDEMAKMWSFGKKQPHFGSGLGYELGKIPGGILGYLTASSAVGGLAPAGSLLSSLANSRGVLGALSGSLGAGIAGAAVTPENRMQGGLIGAGLGLAGETLLPAASSIFNTMRGAGPARQARQLTESLGEIKNEMARGVQSGAEEIKGFLGGNKTLLENAKALGEKIKVASKEQEALGSKMFEDRLGPYKNVEIYRKPKTVHEIHEAKFNPDTSGKEFSIPEKIRNFEISGEPDVADALDAFKDNATIDNAHRLQSQLGYAERSLSKTIDSHGKEKFNKIAKFKKYVQGELDRKIKDIDPSGALSKSLDETSEFWAKNIVPYKNNPKLSQIAKGKITNPLEIAADIPGILKSEGLEAVAGHIGEDFGKHVIYHHLAKQGNLDAGKIINILSNLESKGLDVYKSQRMGRLLQGLETTHNQSKIVNELHSRLAMAKGDAAKTLTAIENAYVEDPEIFKTVNGLKDAYETLAKRVKTGKTVRNLSLAGAGLAGVTPAAIKLKNILQ